ncbi:hypothetical protein, partial [Stenotrophomonas maltophilia]
AGNEFDKLRVDKLEEISGHGLKGDVNGKEVLAGNVKLMDMMKVPVNDGLRKIVDTIVIVAIDRKLAGYLT